MKKITRKYINNNLISEFSEIKTKKILGIFNGGTGIKKSQQTKDAEKAFKKAQKVKKLQKRAQDSINEYVASNAKKASKTNDESRQYALNKLNEAKLAHA